MAILNAKYNTGPTISGSTQKANIAFATGSVDYGQGEWYGGVEDTGVYLIVSDTGSIGRQNTPSPLPTWWKTADQTEAALLAVVNRLPMYNGGTQIRPQDYTTAAEAIAWLQSSPYYCIVPLTSGVDAIRSAIGSTYYSAYDAATVGNFIEVNATAYNNVVAQVSGATSYGTTNEQFAGASGTGWGGFLVSNPTQTPVPSGNYLIAWSGWPSNGGTQILYSSISLSSNNYDRIGNSISVASGSTRRYYVRKAPTSATSSNTYFGYYSSSGMVTKGPTVINQVYKTASVPTTSPPFSTWGGNVAAPALQYIVTSAKSW